jgi:hypothetical protein
MHFCTLHWTTTLCTISTKGHVSFFLDAPHMSREHHTVVSDAFRGSRCWTNPLSVLGIILYVFRIEPMHSHFIRIALEVELWDYHCTAKGHIT